MVMCDNQGERSPTNVWDQLLQEHQRVLHSVLSGSRGSPTPQAPVETIIATALQRSCHLVEGYVALVGQKNLTAASALIRMQLDSAMRVNALLLVDDPMALWQALKEGKQWRRLKSRDGRSLSDEYLHEQLSRKFQCASNLYKQMSSYIHLSTPHLAAATEGEDFLGMKTFLCPAGARIRDEEVRDNSEIFMRVTKALLALCESFVAREPKTT